MDQSGGIPGRNIRAALLPRILEDASTNRTDILADLLAGIVLAVVKVPQAMANAVLASVNPVAGLYALMVAMPVGALFTGSVFMNISTTGALAVAAGEALYYIPEPAKTGALVALVAMAGLFQIVFGALRLGRVMRFVSNSVITGFLTGVAVLVMISSLRDITGFQSDRADHLMRLAETVLNWRSFDPVALTIGGLTIGLVLLIDRTRLFKFSMVLALVVATVLAAFLRGGPIGSPPTLVGDLIVVDSILHLPQLPGFAHLGDLVLPAVSIALIGLLQSAGVGQTFPNPDGRFPDFTKDAMGQGIGNFAASFFGALPSAGSLSGTAVLIRAGARSRFSNVFAGLTVLMIALLLVDLVKLIPMAGLAGLLFVVGLQNIQVSRIAVIWQTGATTRAGFLVTLLGTLFLPLHFAVFLGVATSFVLQILRAANHIEVHQLELVEGGFPVEQPVPDTLAPNDVCVLYLRGALFFASAHSLEAMLPPPSSARNSVVVLVMRETNELGSTLIRFLERYAAELSKSGGKLVLASVSDSLYGQLDRTGLVRRLGKDSVHRRQAAMGASLNEAVVEARAWIARNAQG